MRRRTMSTILKNTLCVLSFLVLLCDSECGGFGVGNSADTNSLLGRDGSQDNYISRKRKSVNEDGSEKSSEGLPDKDHDRSTKRGGSDDSSLGGVYENAMEPSEAAEAQILPNNTVPVSINTSIAANIQPSVTSLTNRGSTAVSLANGSSIVSARLSTWVIVGSPTPSLNEKVTPQSAIASIQGTSSAPRISPTRTKTAVVVSTEQLSSTRVTHTHQHHSPTPTTVTDATTGDVQGRVDDPDEKRKTLFGFVTVEILIALLAGAACAVILVAFLVYRIKKRNEGSYELCEMVNYNDRTYTGKDSEKEVFV